MPVLTFKGLVLAHTAYGSLSRRACEDLDFLIPPDRFRTVRLILEADGYKIAGRQADRNRLRAGIRMVFNRQATFVKGPPVYRLDIHTALMPPSFYYPISFQEFWDRSVSPKDFSGEYDWYIERTQINRLRIAKGRRPSVLMPFSGNSLDTEIQQVIRR